MKAIWVLLLTSAFVFGCASKDKMNNDAGEESKQEEAAKSDDSAKKETDSAGATGERVNCEMKNDKRFMEVREMGKGCELAYSKFGNEEIVATSVAGTEHCKKIAERIQGNLENAGFTCK